MNTINNPPSPIEKIAQINRLLQLDNLKAVKELLVLLLRYFPLDIVAGANVTIEKDTNFSVYKITASGSGTTLLLQTDGVDNPIQNLLNLVPGTNMTITDDGAGNITFDATGGSGGTYTVDNGLTESPANNFQLGGTLIQNTTIDADTYLLDITGTDSIVFQVKNTSTGIAGYFESAADSAVVAQSTGKPAVLALTNGNEWAIYGITKVNGNTIEPIIVAGRAIVSGSVGVGLGGSIDTRLTRSSSNAMTNGSSLITYWSAVGTFASTWELHTVTGNTLTKKMTMLPTGQLNVNNYGIGTFSGTPTYSLGVDASGNVVEFTGGGSSPLTTKGDLYTFDTADARLPVGSDTYILIADSSTPTGLKWGSNTTPPASGYYGAFQDSTTQTAVSANTAYPVKFNTTDLTNGVTVVNDGSGNPTRVTLANTGIYNIQFSLQLEKTGGLGNFIVDIWIRKNGVDIPSTTGKTVLTGSASASPIVAAWNYVLDLVAGDYVQLMWATSNNNAVLLASVATPPHPSIPSSILTVTQQAGILAGTGITGLGKAGFIQTGATQTLVEGTSGTDFNIVSSSNTQTFNIPSASALNRGLLLAADWTIFNNKFNTPTGTTAQYVRGDGTLATFPSIPSAFITYRRLAVSSTLDATDLANVNLNAPYVVEMDVGTANNLTIPLNATVAFPTGSQITVSQYGAGQTTIVATVGVTLRSTGNFLKLAAQYSMCTLMKVGTNEWYVVGQLAP